MREGSLQNFWIKSSTAKTRNKVFFLIAALFAPNLLHAQIILNEFVYDAQGTDNKHEWIELYNSGSNPIDISKWKINDGSNHVLNIPPKNGSIGTTTIESRGFIVLADDAAAFRLAYPSVSGSVIDTSINLPNNGGTIALIDQKGATQDTVAYSASLGAAGTGNSLQRTQAGEWIDAAPTPNTANTEISAPVSVKLTQKPAKKSVQPKKEPKATSRAVVHKVASSAGQEPLKGESDAIASDTIQMTAAASAPVSGISSWFLGALGLTGFAGIAAFAAKRSKKDEWEIIEETD